MRFSVARVLVVTLLSAAAAGTAQASTIVLTFDTPSGPIVANGVHTSGVTFGFTEGGQPSTNAMYGDGIGTTPNLLAPLTDPLLDGPADGVLTLTFDNPTTFLAFDIAFTTSVGPGGTVTVNGTPMTFTTTGNTGMFSAFSIGNFLWTPGFSFTQATIAFDGSASGSQFAMDNVSFDDPPGTPEPGTMGLFGCGLLALGLAARKRR